MRALGARVTGFTGQVLGLGLGHSPQEPKFSIQNVLTAGF